MADLFDLSYRTTSEIIFKIENLTEPLEQKAIAIDAYEKERKYKILKLISRVDNQGKGLITIPFLTQKIKEELGYEVNRSEISKILKFDLQMKWKVAKH